MVELRRFAAHEARAEAESLARRAGLSLQPDGFDLLVEALGADIARIAVEIEKLALYAGNRTISATISPNSCPTPVPLPFFRW